MKRVREEERKRGKKKREWKEERRRVKNMEIERRGKRKE